MTRIVGLATAKVLASRGAKLSIADVSETNLEQAKEAIKEASPDAGEILITKCDVRNYKEVFDWIKKTHDHFGQLDCAANIAGVIGKDYGAYTMEDEDEDNWDFILGVNLKVR